MKNKTLITTLWISSLAFIIITIGLYLFKFNKHDFSNDPESWSRFADYFGGILNPFLSLLNLVILTYLSIRLVKEDDNRNEWTIKELARPYGELTYNKNLWQIEIIVHNLGLGPMIITDINITDENDNSYNNFKDLLKPVRGDVEFEFKSFKFSKNHCAIGKDDNVELLNISGDNNDEKYTQYIKNILEKLKKINIEIKYKDMYQREIGVISDDINFQYTEIE
ncbi:MAG: hypothetical protein ACYC01_01900 [Lutibacter sp.]